MKTKSLLTKIIRLVINIILVDLGVIAIVASIGWFAGWQTQAEFKKAILVAGILVIGIGFLGIKRIQDVSRSVVPESSKSATNKFRRERIQQTLLDITEGYKFMLLMFAAGIICLTIGWLM